MADTTLVMCGNKGCGKQFDPNDKYERAEEGTKKLCVFVEQFTALWVFLRAPSAFFLAGRLG